GEQLDELPNLGPDECGKLTRGAVSACKKTVAGVGKCWSSLFKNTFKAQKLACKDTLDPKECTDFFKAELAFIRAELGFLADVQNEICEEDFAEAVFEACLGV
ncbi:MAG: hypothetical protein ABFS41_13930, partial [Myxococcota bacterium]